MTDEEGHIDFLETQLDLVEKLGVQLYSQAHVGKPEKPGRLRSGAERAPLCCPAKAGPVVGQVLEAASGTYEPLNNRSANATSSATHASGLLPDVSMRACDRPYDGARASRIVDQIVHRVAVVRHRAEVALRHHAAHVLGGRGLQPDHVGAVEQLREGLARPPRCRRRSRSRRARAPRRCARGIRARSGGTCPGRRPRTASRPARRARARSSCRSRRTGSRASRQAPCRGSTCRRRAGRSAQCAARGRPPRAALSGATWAARMRPGRHQVDRDRDRARARSSRAPARSDCLAEFDLREIALRRLALLRQRLARHAALGAFMAHQRADLAQKRGILSARHSGGAAERRSPANPMTTQPAGSFTSRSSRIRSRPACCRCRPWAARSRRRTCPARSRASSGWR